MKKYKYTDITGYLMACKILKRNPKNLPNVSKLPPRYKKHLIALIKLETIAEAINFINNKWLPDYSANNNQEKWFAILRHNGLKGKRAGFGFYGTDYGWTASTAIGGTRLTFSSDAEAIFFGSNKNFVKLHNDMLLLNKF
jgi:hypothetical protein